MQTIFLFDEVIFFGLRHPKRVIRKETLEGIFKHKEVI